MSLTRANLSISATFAEAEAVEHFQNLINEGNNKSFTLAGLDVAEWDEAYSAVFELAAGAGVEIDLTDLQNKTKTDFGYARLLSMMVKSEGGATLVRPGSDNPLEGLFQSVSGTTEDAGIIVPFNGGLAWSFPKTGAGLDVTPTAKTLRFENVTTPTETPTDPAQVTVVLYGSTSPG